MIATALVVFALTATAQCLLVVKLADRLSADTATAGKGREADLPQTARRPQFA